MAEMSVLSKEFVRVPVAAKEEGVVVDPTDPMIPVFMAFVSRRTPVTLDDLANAEWEPEGADRYARCLVGPGGNVELPRGTYDVYVRITDNPEEPMIKAKGVLVVY